MIRLLLIAALLSGCIVTHNPSSAARRANAEAVSAGSPFRWQVEQRDGGSVMHKVLIGAPRPSLADQVLQVDIAGLISAAESRAGRSSTLRMRETRGLGAPPGQVREIWVLESEEGRPIAYVVTLTPKDGGGTDISISGPWQ